MIHVIGDSHSMYTFSGLPVAIHHVGPVTLKRVGYLEDTTLSTEISKLSLSDKDLVLFVFGEIDVRCYVKPTFERAKCSLQQHLGKWADRYGRAVAALDTKGARLGLMSVVPPSASAQMAAGSLFPVTGTDQERVEYTTQLNQELRRVCAERQWLYLDVHALYANETGMLPSELSDGTLHTGDPSRVRTLLAELRLLE